MIIKFFSDGVGFKFIHFYGKPHGTAIRWMTCKPGLFGILIKDSGLHIGFYWQIRFELVAIHVNRF
jgi:hypothetical protein